MDDKGGGKRSSTLSCPARRLHFTFRDLGSRDSEVERSFLGARTDRQASHAVFCFRGGGRVFASSCIWFCIVGVGKTRPEEENDEFEGETDG